MPLDKTNMYWNQQAMSQQQNQFFLPPVAPGQFGGHNYNQMLGQNHQAFPPTLGRQGSLPMPPGLGLGQGIRGLGGGQGSIPQPQGNLGGNPNWSTGLQNAGGQGYTTPGYPPQGFGQQQPQHPMPPTQGYSSQGYPVQGYHGSQQYGGQIPLQPLWEGPKKSGIKGFINNLMAKRKR